MGSGHRIFLIDDSDKIQRIPATRFERLRNRDPKESLPHHKSSRIRFALIILELENRKPISIEWIDYGYLQFDSTGRLDPNFLDAEAETASRLIPMLPFQGKSSGVIQADHKFASKRYKNEFTWSPSSQLEQMIIQKVLG